jgi:hypothetical protein
MGGLNMNGLLFNSANQESGLLATKQPNIIGEVFGIPERTPFDSELKFFESNPNVAGMAADDGKIVMNPFSKLSEQEMNAVKKNEATRVYLKDMPLNFSLTDEQNSVLNSLPFYKSADEQDRRATIIARILSNDPTGGNPTNEQLEVVKKLKSIMGIK